MLPSSSKFDGSGTTPALASTIGCALGALVVSGAIWNVVIVAISVFGNNADTNTNGPGRDAVPSYCCRIASSCAALADFSAAVLPGISPWFSGWVRSFPCSRMYMAGCGRIFCPLFTVTPFGPPRIAAR